MHAAAGFGARAIPLRPRWTALPPTPHLLPKEITMSSAQPTPPDNTTAAVSRNPATGEVFARYPFQGPAEVEANLAAAEAAYRTWRETPVADRARVLAKLADIIETEADALRGDHHARDGQDGEGGEGRGRQMCQDDRLLRQARRRDDRRRARGGRGRRGLRLLPADGHDPWHHAVELPAVAGAARRRADHARRQCLSPEARAELHGARHDARRGLRARRSAEGPVRHP